MFNLEEDFFILLLHEKNEYANFGNQICMIECLDILASQKRT